MKRKLSTAIISLGIVMLAGCAHQSSLKGEEYYDQKYEYLFAESTDLNTIWQKMEQRRIILEEDPTAANREHYMYLFERYIDLVHTRNYATQHYLNTTRHLQVSYGNQGRAGAAYLESGFVHVLGGTPYLPHLTPVRQTVKQTARPTTLSPYDLAWSRYCNNGIGMTADDWKVVHNANYIVPRQYRKNCYPPK